MGKIMFFAVPISFIIGLILLFMFWCKKDSE